MTPSTKRTLHVVINARELPGRRCGVPEGMTYENVHVGVQRGKDVVDLVAGDASKASWAFDIDVVDGADFRGPHVQGKKGDRFFYLSWGVVGAGGGAFTMFRRAKLMLAPVVDVVAAAADGATLVAELGLTMANGTPLCAAVRPPRVTWTLR